MAESIDKKIEKARPRLSIVAPLTHAIIVCFIFGNILIGYGLFTTHVGETARRVPIVNDYLTFEVYGVMFMSLTVLMAYGLFKNNWALLRKSLIFGVLLKSVWTVALVFAVLRGGSIAILGAWATLLALQMVTYIYFVSPPKVFNDK